MSWIRKGSCKQCGECCKTLVSVWFMTGYDAVKGPRARGCIYLKEQPNKRYNCLIKTGDIDWGTLPKNIKEYHLRECISYPNPQDPSHCPPEYYLPETCGYRIVEVK